MEALLSVKKKNQILKYFKARQRSVRMSSRGCSVAVGAHALLTDTQTHRHADSRGSAAAAGRALPYPVNPAASPRSAFSPRPRGWLEPQPFPGASLGAVVELGNWQWRRFWNPLCWDRRWSSWTVCSKENWPSSWSTALERPWSSQPACIFLFSWYFPGGSRSPGMVGVGRPLWGLVRPPAHAGPPRAGCRSGCVGSCVVRKSLAGSTEQAVPPLLEGEQMCDWDGWAESKETLSRVCIRFCIRNGGLCVSPRWYNLSNSTRYITFRTVLLWARSDHSAPPSLLTQNCCWSETRSLWS